MMNILETYAIDTPYGEQDICPKFTIDEILNPFTLHNIMTTDKQYSFSLWVKSEADGGLLIHGNDIPTSTEWTKHSFTFTAKEENFDIHFGAVGVYYIYHPQLENGNKSTDWSKSPDDVEETIQRAQNTADDANATASSNTSRIESAESIIQQLVDKISMLVTDSEGTTLWEQTSGDGWTFSMAQTKTDIETIRDLLSDLEEELGGIDATVEVLNNSLTDIESSLEWVKVTTYEDEPCIALGETDSDFKLLITNTRIMFVEGSSVPAYISNQALNIKKAVIEEELQQGEFVWKIRTKSDGRKNFGLLWKGVSS